MSTRGSFGFRVEDKDFLFRYLHDTFPAHLLKYLIISFENVNYDVEAIRNVCKNLKEAEDKDLPALVEFCTSIISDRTISI